MELIVLFSQMTSVIQSLVIDIGLNIKCLGKRRMFYSLADLYHTRRYTNVLLAGMDVS